MLGVRCGEAQVGRLFLGFRGNEDLGVDLKHPQDEISTLARTQNRFELCAEGQWHRGLDWRSEVGVPEEGG